MNWSRKFSGYCYYTASNPTWGFDAYLRLRAVDGDEGRLSTQTPTGRYYSPTMVYLFPNEQAYLDFQILLEETGLSGLIRVYEYHKLPETARVRVDTINLDDPEVDEDIRRITHKKINQYKDLIYKG